MISLLGQFFLSNSSRLIDLACILVSDESHFVLHVKLIESYFSFLVYESSGSDHDCLSICWLKTPTALLTRTLSFSAAQALLSRQLY